MSLLATGAAVWAAPGPITREGAAEDARRELSRDVYRRNETGIVERILNWIFERIGDLSGRAAGSGPEAGWAWAIGALLVVLAVVAVVIWFGPLRRTARVREEFSSAPPEATPAALRSLADELASAGRYAEAIRERLRGVVRALARRGVVEERPGRTAREIGAAAAAALPGAAADLAEAVELFSDVWYGGRTATAEADARMRMLADRVAAVRERDSPAEDEPVPAGWAAPGTGAPP